MNACSCFPWSIYESMGVSMGVRIVEVIVA